MYSMTMTSLDLTLQIKARIAALTDPKLALSDLTLTSCDREPIHIPNTIQPHGVLLTFTEADCIILQISDNSEAFLDRTPEELLGQPLSELLTREQIESILSCANAEFEQVNVLRLTLLVGWSLQRFECWVHRSDGMIVLEMERSTQHPDINAFDFYKCVKAPLNQLQNSHTLAELSHQAVMAIYEITKFDRVMLYRFDEDGSGHVIAEKISEGIESFLGLHFPATDIPKQAKELYRLNSLRIIPDVMSKPVLIKPSLNPTTGKALDMSLSGLRGVSPLHTEYLENMGVRSSMSISILRDRQLWGLIACHHHAPKSLSYETRTNCEFLGQVLSLQIGSKADTEDLDYKMKLQTVHNRFVNTIATCRMLGDGLKQNPTDLMNLAGSSGVVFCEGTMIESFGNTPPSLTIAALLEWVDQKIGEGAVYSTSTLVTDYPAFLPYKQVASGLIALRISRVQQIYLLWFRPEVVQTINWAGEPTKPTGIDTGKGQRIAPRKSFELWKETVQLKSLPWKACEIEAVLELRSSIIGVVLNKSDELALINTELERSNIELDAFAYVASHDLREPLRGIFNYSTFLSEDYGTQLGEDGNHKIKTLMRLAQRMEDLINSLLHYSQINRTGLVFQPVDLGALLETVLDLFRVSQPEDINFQVLRPLPIVHCDQSQINVLFTNLISNAIKYNDQDKKQIEIGYFLVEELNSEEFNVEKNNPQLLPFLKKTPDQTIFFVKDNGIGVQAKHSEIIFKIFKRLHAVNKYGGGTGAGLTIARKIVERHGGIILLESTVGQGTTFYFSLGQKP